MAWGSIFDLGRPSVPVAEVLFPRLFHLGGDGQHRSDTMNIKLSDFPDELTSPPRPLSTVSFTGHRRIGTSRLSNTVGKYQWLQKHIEKTVNDLYNQGYNIFMSGMAEGFDLMAAKVVLDLRQELKNLKLICVIPFRGQENRFNPCWKELYAEVLASADETVYISERYSESIFLRRNDFLVAHCSCVVCYYDGSQRSGTGYTVRRAERAHHKIINLYDSF